MHPILKKSVAVTTILIAVLFAAMLIIRSNERAASEDRKIDIEHGEVVADNLNTVWDIAILPDGDILATERSGTVKRIGGITASFEVPDVLETSEGGLMGLALHPNFSDNREIYLYLTVRKNGEIKNRVERHRLTENALENKTIIIDDIPGADRHNGGRIAFGPDDLLYVTTGDALIPNLSQDTNSLAGKILRVNPDGSPAENNPFGNLVYSYGHRNPQGLAWDSQGRLWSVEHGPAAQDEINLIEAGENYGWPIIEGGQRRQGMRTPNRHSGNDTWAPGGLAIINDTCSLPASEGNPCIWQ
jgi:aldose sugar dehydrogenase